MGPVIWEQSTSKLKGTNLIHSSHLFFGGGRYFLGRCILVELGVDLKALILLGRHFTTWTISLSLFALITSKKASWILLVAWQTWATSPGPHPSTLRLIILLFYQIKVRIDPQACHSFEQENLLLFKLCIAEMPSIIGSVLIFLKQLNCWGINKEQNHIGQCL
jgi:hypothetical protein